MTCWSGLQARASKHDVIRPRNHLFDSYIGQVISGAFNRLWLAVATANLADGVILTGLPLMVVASGGGVTEVSVTTVAATIAWPLFGVFAGGIVDRFPAHRVALVVSIVRVVIFAALAAVGAPPIALIVIVAALYGLSETLADTALVALVPAVVERSELTRANGRIEATLNVANQFVGPPLAGLLITLSVSALVAPVAALYAVTVVAVILLGRRMVPRVREKPAVRDRAAVVRGLQLIFSDRRQRELTLLTGAMNLVWGAWTAIFVIDALAPGRLGWSTFEYGLVLSGMAVGGVIASIVTPWLHARLGTTLTLILDAIGTALLVVPAALLAPGWVVIAGLVIAGAGSSVWRILVSSIRQQITPEPLLGRVYSASRVISWGTLPVGAALAGALATFSTVQAAFIGASALAIAILVWAAVSLPRLKLAI